MKPENFFSPEEKNSILAAIREAETQTSGEIRVHIESNCNEDVLDRAAFIFEKLKMHRTELRNGVLFYLSVNDRKFAILGDAGINHVTPENFWNEIKETVLTEFAQNRYADGICIGIQMAGQALRAKFPCQSDDVNELSNDLSFGKN
ncbi:MAG: TPM domain-containing protein [Bacteroidota bacterium]|nr:MAG: TPM domain-containing protein [Bacteroidota bacterium]